MSQAYDDYFQAVQALDAIGPRYERAVAEAEAAKQATRHDADQVSREMTAAASELTERAQSALARGRDRLGVGDQDRLPARVHAGPPAGTSAADAANELTRRIAELDAAMTTVEAHRAASRQRRLDEASAREQQSDEARRLAAAEAQRAAAERTYLAWQTATRKANGVAGSVAGVVLVLASILVATGAIAFGVVAFGGAVLASILVRNRLLPAGPPPPRPIDSRRQ